MSYATTHPFSRYASIIALTLVAGPLAAGERDEEGYKTAYHSKLQALVAGKKRGDDPKGHVEWMKERMGGALPASFMDHFARVAERERAIYPDRYLKGRLAPVALTPGTKH